jgi:hypothetical protein
MIDITRGLITHLRADPNLASMLSEFSGHSAVFPASPVPETADTPFVVIGGPVSDSRFGGGIKQQVTREVVTDIGVYSDANGNILAVEEPAEYLRWKLEGFNQFGEFVRNWSTPITEVTGPVLNDMDDLYGRVISVRFVMLRDQP